MFLKKIKKYLIIILFFFFLFVTKANALYPVGIYDVDPTEQFWVTTQGPNGTTSLDVIDINSSEILKTIKELSSTTENLYAETLRNNYWTLYNEETRNEKEQSLSKYKALKLQNIIEESILSWVNEGFNTDENGKGGKPAYIEDEAAFLDEMEKKIKEDFKKLLDIYYQYAPEEEKNYLDKIKKILGSNTEKAIDNDDYYLEEGSDESMSDEEVEDWDQWLGLSTNEFTNPMIAFLDAKDNLENLILNEKIKYQKEIENGNGFLSFKKCTIRYYTIDGSEDGNGKTYYGDPYYIKTSDIWDNGLPEYDYPVVSCTTIIPGYLIAEQVSDIYMSKYNFIKETAISTNGNDLVLDSIEGDLKDFETKIMKIGVIGRTGSEGNDDLYSDLNEAIEKASEELKKRDGGNTKISDDMDDPRNTKSRFYPKNFLTSEKWKEIWDFKQSSNNNWYSWFDYLYDWQKDNWTWNETQTQ